MANDMSVEKCKSRWHYVRGWMHTALGITSSHIIKLLLNSLVI